MDRPAVPSRIAPGDGDILLDMRYNCFDNGSIDNDDKQGRCIGRERRRE